MKASTLKRLAKKAPHAPETPPRPKAAAGPKKAPAPPPEAAAWAPETLAGPDAKEAIKARFPRVVVKATKTCMDPLVRDAAIAAKRLSDRKAAIEAEADVYKNALKLVVGDHYAAEGPGWRATWGERRGDVDVEAMVRDGVITQEVADRYRKPGYRELRVTVREVAARGKERAA